MLVTIAVVLGILWLLGFITANTFGGFLHLLLVIAAIVVLIRLIQGRSVV
ncbi:lmo0937 family membrane protein [Candidatus Nomurabacteria bacterium]|nr:lmo0937 family membrane protein [Candidatus Nomurabacteria bacterium]